MRRYKVTTKASTPLPVADNLLARDFTASAPNQKWTADIPYIDIGLVVSSDGRGYLLAESDGLVDVGSHQSSIGQRCSQDGAGSLLREAIPLPQLSAADAAALVVKHLTNRTRAHKSRLRKQLESSFET